MASCYTMSFLISLMVVVVVAGGADPVHTYDDYYISPSLSPYTDKIICEDVECGKGKCKVDLGIPFGFKCECEAGWKRTRLQNEDDFHFLPCIVPKCSLDYSCMTNAPPAPAVPYNVSVYDPCYWIYCGEGTCKWNKPYKHTCECKRGYSNALDISFYPCYSDCALGSDCEKLGVVRSMNSSSTSANGGPRATPYLAGRSLWMSSFMVSIAIVLWK